MVFDPAQADGLENPVVDVYARAELYLIRLIRDALARTGDGPDWAEAQLLMIRQERGNIEGLAQTLQDHAASEVHKAVDAAYIRGVITAEAELAALPESTGYGFATPVGTTALNDAAVVALAAEATRSLATVHQNILRNTEDVWRRIVGEASGFTVTGAMTPQQAMSRAYTRMAREGLGFFTDRRGRKWGLDTYAEMATRTATNRALRAGHTASLVEHGVDLVVISSHPNPAPMCAPYERKVVSLTGMYSAGRHRVEDRIVSVAATMAEAEANGLHHPNAILGGDQTIDTFAGAVGASKGTYRGPAISIRTAKGHRLTVSPEHPVLTGSGWRTAESIGVGDNVFNPAGRDPIPTDTLDSAYVDDVPTTVEDEFVAVEKIGSSSFVPSAGHNFNDDRKFIEGEVHVVVTDDCLLPVPDTHVIEESGKVHFAWSDVGGVGEVGDCPHPLGGHGVFGSVGRPLANFYTGSYEAAPDRGAGGVEHGGDVLAAQARGIEVLDPLNINGLVSDLIGSESGAFEAEAYARRGDSHDPRTVGSAVPGGIELDEVVYVDRFTFTGHAYDFQTVDGVYSLGGIITHNCRHTHSAYLPGFTDLTPPPADPDNRGYKATQEQRRLEREIRASKRMENAAITDEDVRKASARKRAYQAKLRDHIDQHDLPRRRHREQLRRPIGGRISTDY